MSGHAPSIVPFENDWSRFMALVTPSHGSCGLPDDAVESVLLLVKSAVEHLEVGPGERPFPGRERPASGHCGL